MLVLLNGLPATGKSAIAEAVARALPAAWLSVDPIEAAMLRVGIDREHRSDVAAYEVAFVLADAQLATGQHAVVDAVNGYPPVQERWQDLAARHRAGLVVVHTHCSDPALHRARLEGRRRNLHGFPYEPSWADVEAMPATWYVPFPEPDLSLDAVEPLEGNVARAVALVCER
jgi:predicted kinase